MSTPFSIAVKIWVKTITLAIFICGIGIILEERDWAILFIGLSVIFGYLVTSPLLIIILPLVKWSSRIPYANRAKMAWLIFLLFLLYFLIYTLFMLLTGAIHGDFIEVFKTKEGAIFILSIIVVQYIAVRSTRTSLYKLYDQPK